jgi:hypothetical protein
VEVDGPMGSLTTKTNAKEASIEAIVIRADGSRENLGTIAYWHRNPMRRLWWQVKQKIR